jgi:hypothetical protein
MNEMVRLGNDMPSAAFPQAMDGRPKLLLLKIENQPTPALRTSHLKIKQKTATDASTEPAHSLERVERDTQQAKPALHFPPFLLPACWSIWDITIMNDIVSLGYVTTIGCCCTAGRWHNLRFHHRGCSIAGRWQLQRNVSWPFRTVTTRICSTTRAFGRSPTESFVLAIKDKYEDEEAEHDGRKRAELPQRQIQQVRRNQLVWKM